MDFTDAFRIVNLATGVLLLLGGIGTFFSGITIHNVILAVYLFLFGGLTGLLEFQIPPQVTRYGSFFFSFLGRGILYVFLGSILLGDKWYLYVPGGLIAFIGLAYAVLEFIPSIEPPANMRDADAGWGAEQV